MQTQHLNKENDLMFHRPICTNHFYMGILYKHSILEILNVHIQYFQSIADGIALVVLVIASLCCYKFIHRNVIMEKYVYDNAIINNSN